MSSHLENIWVSFTINSTSVPAGIKAMTVDESWSWNIPTDSGWFTLGSTRRKFGAIDEFAEMTSTNEAERGGGGGAIGESVTYEEALAFLGIDPGYGHPLLNVTRTKLVNGKLVPIEYGFKQSVAYLLSLMSGVNYDDVVATTVTFKDYGVGALTTGNNSDSGTITNFDVNFNNIVSFLELMSHEVGHLPQLGEAGGNLTHLTKSGWGYLKSAVKNKSVSYEDYHDKAPLEMAAEKGFYNFKDFNQFINNNIGKNRLELLFKNRVSTEAEKSQIIQKWFNAYYNNVYGKNNYK